MYTSQNDDSNKQTPTEKSPVVLLLGTIADTTWRMFIPVIGLMVAGLVVDKKLGSTPWIMIIGLIFGVILAAILVLRQLNKVQK